MHFLPSKTFFIALCGVLLLGVALFLAFGGSSVKYGEAEDSMAAFKRAQELAVAETSKKDTDKDGLRDWEETLWGTDVNNEDTDGDGTPDGDEVDANRNPSKAGPDDAMAEVAEVSNSGFTEASPENLTDTERFATDFFKHYMAIRNSGTLSETSAQELVLELSEQFSALQAPAYKQASLRITVASGPDALRAYANHIATVILRNLPEDPTGEMIIVGESLGTQDPKVLERLNPLISIYKQAARESLTVETPRQAAAIHLNLVNSFSRLERITTDFSLLYTDPLRSLAALRDYPQATGELIASFKDLATLFSGSGLEFYQGEPWHELTQQ